MTRPTDLCRDSGDEGVETAFLAPRLDAGGLVATSGRAAIPLDGEWRFTLDPHREGLRHNWPALDAAPSSEWTRPRGFDGGWQTLPVPGTWTMARPELYRYEGAAWYGRDLDLDPTGGQLVLCVGAATGRTRVFLNGSFLGLHIGGTTPFCVDLTPAARPGRNLLMIELDTTRLPADPGDGFSYGGLYRDVALYSLPRPHLTDFTLQLDAGGIALRLSLSEPADGTAELDLAGFGTWQVAVEGGEGRAVLPVTPELWSPEAPRLHDVTLRFGADLLTERIGFRRIERQGTRLMLNGQPLRLRGFCVHEDDINGGPMSDEADLRRRFRHIRELGGNAARLIGGPHHPLAPRIADEMGLMLWSEVAPGLAGQRDAETQLAEMIRRDANRASVILWGIGGAGADGAARLPFLTHLAETARRLDPSRLVTAVCALDQLADPLAAPLDVIGIAEYDGWTTEGFDGLERRLAYLAPDRPVLIAETGAEAEPGLRGPETQLFTEERQAMVLRRQLEICARPDYVAGIFPQALYDHRSDRSQTRHHRGWNRMGVLAEDKATRKRAFLTVSEAYRAQWR